MTTHSIDNWQDYEDALGRSVVARLTDSAEVMPHNITERLKVARMQALSKRKVVQVQVASEIAVSGGTLAMHPGGRNHRIWNWLGSLVPLAALVVGLLAINLAQDGIRANEMQKSTRNC